MRNGSCFSSAEPVVVEHNTRQRTWALLSILKLFAVSFMRYSFTKLLRKYNGHWLINLIYYCTLYYYTTISLLCIEIVSGSQRKNT